MQAIRPEGIVNILSGTLNHVDARLADHGMRVSYMTYRLLNAQGRYSRLQLRDMCLIALLHDIGAYRTEEINQMLRFETVAVWDHSIWGYLYLLYFSPLADLAPAVLYHHCDYGQLPAMDAGTEALAQTIHLADRADVLVQLEGMSWPVVLDTLHQERGARFREDLVDTFRDTFPVPITMEMILQDRDYHTLMHDMPFTDEAIAAYLRLNVLSIDFRSHNTAAHTITTSACSRELALYMGMDAPTAQIIATGAMLHDLGKTGIPLEVLEYPGRLSPQAMEIMKRHVGMTESILVGNVSEDVLRIAIRHHEKLDGTGYPRGLSAGDLTLPERIVAVADIVSALYEARSYKQHYPKARILDIIHRMAEEGLIDATVVAVMHTHFDTIAARIDATREPILEHYEVLRDAYARLKGELDADSRTPPLKRPPSGDTYLHLR